MQIVIDIPKEFEEHFNSDRFEDSLARVASDIESFGFQLAGRYEQETVTMLRKAIKNSTPLPKGHGRLIDADELYLDIQTDEEMRLGEHLGWVKDRFDNALTIIEADKGESEVEE